MHYEAYYFDRNPYFQAGASANVKRRTGAKYFSMEIIIEKTGLLENVQDLEPKLCGLLIIDTAGHKSSVSLDL